MAKGKKQSKKRVKVGGRKSSNKGKNSKVKKMIKLALSKVKNQKKLVKNKKR